MEYLLRPKQRKRKKMNLKKSEKMLWKVGNLRYLPEISKTKLIELKDEEKISDKTSEKK